MILVFLESDSHFPHSDARASVPRHLGRFHTRSSPLASDRPTRPPDPTAVGFMAGLETVVSIEGVGTA